MSHESPHLLNFFPRAHSIRDLKSDVAGTGKKEAKYRCIRQPIPDASFFGHFSGEKAVSVQPILDGGNTCQWGAIDIDSYGDPKLIDKVRSACQLFGIPCFIEQSKSLGVHVYIFLDRPVIAKPFRKALQKLAVWIGHPKAEIRPAQDEIDFAAGDVGTFMVLPGFGIGLEKMQKEVERWTVTVEDFNKLTDEGEFSDGPPCLFPLEAQGKANGFVNRNLHLYQLAIYFRYKYATDWDQRLLQYNQTVLDEPLPEKEVVALVEQLKKNGKCHYRCSGEPFEAVCNRTACQFRKYGVAARESTSSIIAPEGITILDTDPPVWFVTLTNPKNNESVRVKLTTDQLLNVNAFKKRCLETIQVIPTLPKQKEWEVTVSQMLANAQHLPVPFEMTEEARVLDAIAKFCLSTIKSSQAEDLLRGRVWFERKDGLTHAHFRQVDLTNYLTTHRIGSLKSNEIHAILNELCRLGHLTVEKLNLGGPEVTVFRTPIHSRYMEMQAEIDSEGKR